MSESTPGDVNNPTETPITKKPIQPVNSIDWMTCHIRQCYKELDALRERQYMMQQMNKPEIANQIQSGIDVIQNIINRRMNEKGGKIL